MSLKKDAVAAPFVQVEEDEDGVLKPFTRNMRRQISRITQGKADVVNYDYLDGTVIEEAVKEGVVVYEHHV